MSSLPKTMRTAVMEDIQKIGHVIRPLPEASEHEVIVKIEHVGISFYDLTYYATGRIQDFVAVPPFVLGREAGGKVVFCGEDVNHLKVGDTVALEPILFCGTCELCKIGHYHLCQEERIFGSPPLDGFFSEFVVHPACLTHKVPNSLDSLDASLIEPMAIGFHAAKLTEAKLGQRVVIFGAGATGIMCLLALRANGINRITMVDFFTSRLLKAKELGAKDINFPDPEDLNQDLTNFSQNKNFDIAIDAAGTAQAIKNALYSLKKGGILVLAKYTPNSELTVPINVAIYKELTLKTVFRYHDAFPAVIETVREGIVRPREVVTDIFNFNDIQEGMTRSLKEKSKILKAIVKI